MFVRKCVHIYVLTFVFSALTFAGSASSQTLAPSWQWIQMNLATSFPARAAFASAYDPISKKVIVFGGTDEVS